jgi:urease accessory protein
MRARAAVGVTRTAGGDRLTTLRSDPPLTFRPTPTGLHLVGTSAGPLAGDDLGLDVAVGAGAHLTVRSVAATLVQPGARPSVSMLRITADVGANGTLEWVPQPTVAVRGCDHESSVHVRLAAGAGLVWRDELVLGRYGEASGSLLSRLVIDRAGRPVLRTDLAVGPRWPGSQGPAGVGAGTRAVGTAVVVGPGAERLRADADDPHADRADEPATGASGPPGMRLAILPLADPDAVMVTVVGPSAGLVSVALDAVLARATVATATQAGLGVRATQAGLGVRATQAGLGVRATQAGAISPG